MGFSPPQIPLFAVVFCYVAVEKTQSLDSQLYTRERVRATPRAQSGAFSLDPFHWALVSSVFPLCLEIVNFHG